MQWIVARLSVLLTMLFAAATSATMSQSVAFTNAYLQRLGGHIDEAKRQLESLRAGDIGRLITESATREQLLDIFQRRVSDLEAARDAIVNASVFVKPLICLFNLDAEIAWGTVSAFVPSVPLDAAGLFYGVLGFAVGWGLWGLMRRWFRRGDKRPDARAV
ncbi:MAG: hypothetical protein ACI9MJ_002736 [Alphaproteobacteria bacterium]|jgi:hypothetical protein